MSTSEPARQPPPVGRLPVGALRQVWARRDATEAEAKAMASSVRLQILRLALHEPRTNRELAVALGRHPASVLHHVRTLVDTGFLIEHPPRRGRRGAREVPYLASGKSWYLNDGRTDAGTLVAAFLAEIDRAPQDRVETTRVGFRIATERRVELLDRLFEVLTELADSPSDPDAEPWGLFLAVHPEVAGDDPTSS